MSKNVKKRNWAFVLYPESAPEDWREQLQKTGLQCAISPLHERDINPDNTPKKPHYHVILAYSGPTSYNVVKSLTDSFNQPIPQPLEQVRGYYRYLSHKDNPEKAQYDEREIRTINGFNIADFSELTRSEVTQIKRTLQGLIRQYDIIEYAELMDFLQDEEMNVEYEVASNNTLFFDRYIGSRRHSFSRIKDIKKRAEEAQSTENQQHEQHEQHEEIHEKCCTFCGSMDIKKFGRTQAGRARMRCNDCGKTWVI